MENSSLRDNKTTTEDILINYPTTAIIITEIFIMLWITTGNTLVIAAYWKHKYLQTIPNSFVIQLAIADLCVGVSLIYTVLLSYFMPTELIKENIILCALTHALLSLPTLVSLLFLLVITLDRYVAVFYPLKYPSIMTRKRAQVMAAGLWTGTALYIITAVTHSLLYNISTGQEICYGDEGNFESRIMGYTYLPLFLVVMIIIVALYIRIFWTVRKQLDQHDIEELTNLQKNVKLIKTAVIVIGLFIVCWAPYVVLASGYTMGFFSVKQKQNMFNIYMATYHIAVMNSGMNFIIYPVRSKDFRSGMKTIICCNGRCAVTQSGINPA